MSVAEGNSLNRYIFQGKEPTKDDFNRVLAVFRKLKENEPLAYASGLKVSDDHLARVQEKL